MFSNKSKQNDNNKSSLSQDDKKPEVIDYNEREQFSDDADMDKLLREKLLKERKKRDNELNPSPKPLTNK